MSREPKTPQDSQTQHEAAQTAGTSGVGNASAGRRAYKAPVVKRLGSVRDLTLGSPPNMFSDGIGFQKNKGM